MGGGLTIRVIASESAARGEGSGPSRDADRRGDRATSAGREGRAGRGARGRTAGAQGRPGRRCGPARACHELRRTHGIGPEDAVGAGVVCVCWGGGAGGGPARCVTRKGPGSDAR